MVDTYPTTPSVGDTRTRPDGTVEICTDATAPYTWEIIGGSTGPGVVTELFTSSGTYTRPAGTRYVQVLAWGSGDAGDPTGASYTAAELGATAAVTIGDGAGSPTDTTFNPAGSGATLTATGATGNDGIVIVTAFLGESYGSHDEERQTINCIENASLSASASSGALTITLNDAYGNTPTTASPVRIPMRSSTDATGTPQFIEITSATTLVVPSGATLGVTSSEAFRIWVVAFEDGEIGVINCFAGSDTVGDVDNIYPLSPQGTLDYGPITAAAIGTGSDSAGVMYATSDQSGNAFAILGYLEWGASGLTAGTWTTTNLISIQMFGPGVALPGTLIQSVYAETTDTASSTSTTFSATDATYTITLTSSANVVRAQATGTVAITPTSSNGQMETKIYRTTATSVFGNTSFLYEQGTLNFYLPTTMIGFDKPNSTSAVTYGVAIRRPGGTGTVFYGPNSVDNNMLLQEIMT